MGVSLDGDGSSVYQVLIGKTTYMKLFMNMAITTYSIRLIGKQK